jgi:hypothetical protein
MLALVVGMWWRHGWTGGDGIEGRRRKKEKEKEKEKIIMQIINKLKKKKKEKKGQIFNCSKQDENTNNFLLKKKRHVL